MKLKTDNDTGKIVFTFDPTKSTDDDGNAVSTPVADATFDVNDNVHFDLCIHAMMKSFENRIKDVAAIARKQTDGSIINVTETMRRTNVVDMIEYLQSGTDQWNRKGAGRKPAQNTAILALATKLDKTYEEAEAYIANLAIEELGGPRTAADKEVGEI